MINLENVDRNDMFAAVRLDGQLRFYVAYQPIWIMNYTSYSGGGSENDPDDWMFRNNMCVVDDSNAHQFVDAIQEYEVGSSDIQAILDRELISVIRLPVLFDFDARLYVDGTFGDELCRFVPPGWACTEDWPMLHLSGTVYVWPQWPTITPYRPHD
jgi:hypothetical protein